MIEKIKKYTFLISLKLLPNLISNFFNCLFSNLKEDYERCKNERDELKKENKELEEENIRLKEIVRKLIDYEALKKFLSNLEKYDKKAEYLIKSILNKIDYPIAIFGRHQGGISTSEEYKNKLYIINKIEEKFKEKSIILNFYEKTLKEKYRGNFFLYSLSEFLGYLKKKKKISYFFDEKLTNQVKFIVVYSKNLDLLKKELLLFAETYNSALREFNQRWELDLLIFIPIYILRKDKTNEFYNFEPFEKSFNKVFEDVTFQYWMFFDAVCENKKLINKIKKLENGFKKQVGNYKLLEFLALKHASKLLIDTLKLLDLNLYEEFKKTYNFKKLNKFIEDLQLLLGYN